MLYNPKILDKNSFLDIPNVESQDSYFLAAGGKDYLEEHLKTSMIAVKLDGAIFLGEFQAPSIIKFHGLIWSHKVFKAKAELHRDAKAIFRMFPAIQELSVVVPKERQGLRRFLEFAGFKFVLTMQKVYPENSACQDGSLYSILRKKIGGHYGSI